MPYGKGTYGSKVAPKKAQLLSGCPLDKKIARQAGNPNKIDAADFKKLHSRRGMK